MEKYSHKSKYIYSTREFNSKDVLALRKDTKLRPVVTGLRLCLKCDKEFFSENLSINRVCTNCKNNSDYF